MNIINFIRQSNEIESIFRDPTEEEVIISEWFLSLKVVTISNLISLVKVYQPEAVLRNHLRSNVRIGNHFPMKGGPQVVYTLQQILDEMVNIGPYHTHILYENLHPFTDGNGRSGRMLWAWGMGAFERSFLHEFYYQTLDNNQRK